MESVAHTLGRSPALQKMRHGFGDAASVAMRGLRKTGRVLAAACKSAQQARLAAVLANMSDAQLRQIGIARSEIWTHVEMITSDNYDGL